MSYIPGTETSSPPVRLSLPSIRLRFSERRLLLGALDLFVVTLALLLSLSLRENSSALASLPRTLVWIALLGILWLAVATIVGIYDLALAAKPLPSMWSSARAALVTSVLYLFIPYLTPVLPTRRWEVILLPLFMTVGVSIWRLLYATIFMQPTFHQRVLVIGAGRAGRSMTKLLTHLRDEKDGPVTTGVGYRVLGYIDDDPEKLGQEMEGVPVLGTRHEVLPLVETLQPDIVVVAITETGTVHDDLFRAILDCREQGIQVTTVTHFYERLTGRVPLQHAGRSLNVVFPLGHTATQRLYDSVRRLLDILVGLMGCLLLVPIAFFVWIGNLLSSPGPLFYRQMRTGRGNQQFEIVKFRSMINDAEKESGAVWASHQDDRITSLGRFLRRARIDELPQFWNILRGEMSLIGPRPERPEFVIELAEEIPFYRARHAVRPGITGWAQVNCHYAASTEDTLTKVQYDLYYIKYQSPFLDLQILLRTIQVVLHLEGR